MDMDVTAKFRADISDMAAKMAALDKQLKGLGDSAEDAGKKIGDRMQEAGQKMTNVGKKMSLAITAPLAGIGIAAAKTSMDFETSLSKMVGLVGLTTDEVDGMRDSVLQLAGATAKSPQELADALFVVTSAGLRGDAAIQALDQAARASAAGLGETADIARSVAGAVNAYGTANLSAAKATDVIVATARAGNFETSQFAAAVGRVLPFAKQAGSSIEDGAVGKPDSLGFRQSKRLLLVLCDAGHAPHGGRCLGQVERGDARGDPQEPNEDRQGCGQLGAGKRPLGLARRTALRDVPLHLHAGSLLPAPANLQRASGVGPR